MAPLKRAADSVQWFMSELASRVVAGTGIPSDRHHLGKLILQSLKDAPDFILQIDAATGQSETYKSVLERTVRCAECYKELGLKKGDVIVVAAPNHIDLCIPMYAAFYLGIIVAALDHTSSVVEFEGMFTINQAKIIFCNSERASAAKTALKNINLEARVIAFNEGSDYMTFADFMQQYGKKADAATFQATNLDPVESVVYLTCTSGTTGLPKSAALTYTNLVLSLPQLWTRFSTFPTPVKLALVASPIHWLSAGFHFLMSPILRYTRLQTSAPFTKEHFEEIVSIYKPNHSILSPTLMISLIKCDFTCFEYILVGGSAVPQQLLDEMRTIAPNTTVHVGYGMSEVGGISIYDDLPVLGSTGRLLGLFDYRLVDVDTKEDIMEPNVKGELWLKGPTLCKGYYNDPEASAEAMEDGWLKSGDIFYRDEYFYFYFVEKLKLLLKYKNHQISPVELENVIRQHPGVLDAAVTGIPDLECGDLPVACVVRKKGHTISAQEIKDLVKDTLTDSKQLRGGVIFMEELPLTSSTKLHRQELKKIVLASKRE